MLGMIWTMVTLVAGFIAAVVVLTMLAGAVVGGCAAARTTAGQWFVVALVAAWATAANVEPHAYAWGAVAFAGVLAVAGMLHVIGGLMFAGVLAGGLLILAAPAIAKTPDLWPALVIAAGCIAWAAWTIKHASKGDRS
jgi:hypothetical protein